MIVKKCIRNKLCTFLVIFFYSISTYLWYSVTDQTGGPHRESDGPYNEVLHVADRSPLAPRSTHQLSDEGGGHCSSGNKEQEQLKNT